MQIVLAAAFRRRRLRLPRARDAINTRNLLDFTRRKVKSPLLRGATRRSAPPLLSLCFAEHILQVLYALFSTTERTERLNSLSHSLSEKRTNRCKLCRIFS